MLTHSAIAEPLDQARGVVNVRRARESDYPAIATFIEESYGELAPFKARERWNWQFVNNPYLGDDTDFVPVWIAETSGRVVGQIAVQAGDIEIDGVTHRAGWIVDVMILQSYRGLGLGHKLYAEVSKDWPILVTLTMALATRRMAERLGAVDLGEVKLYSRIGRLNGRTVERFLRIRTAYHPRLNSLARRLCRYLMIHRLLSGTGNILVSMRNALGRAPSQRRDTTIFETDRFGPESELLWRRISAGFPIAFERDSKFLNWRFRQCPQLKYRCFLASRNGLPVGYIVLREAESVELPIGIIVDLMAERHDGNTVRDLLAFALEFFGNNVAAIQCATSIPEFAAILSKAGFHCVRTERPNCVASDESVRQRLSESSADWLFSKADHDWDQIHLA